MGSYKHLFDKLLVVDEAETQREFIPLRVHFLQLKTFFNYLNPCKKGRIKRNMTARIVGMNRLVG